jgi:hypothetical protein
MISAIICLTIGVCLGVFVMGLLAGGKCQELQHQLDAKSIECIDCMRKKCGDCYEVRQLKKSNAALRGDNKKMYQLQHGNKGNARVLFDLWAQQNKVSQGEG